MAWENVPLDYDTKDLQNNGQWEDVPLDYEQTQASPLIKPQFQPGPQSRPEDRPRIRGVGDLITQTPGIAGRNLFNAAEATGETALGLGSGLLASTAGLAAETGGYLASPVNPANAAGGRELRGYLQDNLTYRPTSPVAAQTVENVGKVASVPFYLAQQVREHATDKLGPNVGGALGTAAELGTIFVTPRVASKSRAALKTTIDYTNPVKIGGVLQRSALDTVRSVVKPTKAGGATHAGEILEETPSGDRRRALSQEKLAAETILNNKYMVKGAAADKSINKALDRVAKVDAAINTLVDGMAPVSQRMAVEAARRAGYKVANKMKGEERAELLKLVDEAAQRRIGNDFISAKDAHNRKGHLQQKSKSSYGEFDKDIGPAMDKAEAAVLNMQLRKQAPVYKTLNKARNEQNIASKALMNAEARTGSNSNDLVTHIPAVGMAATTGLGNMAGIPAAIAWELYRNPNMKLRAASALNNLGKKLSYKK